ncbi:MAG: heme exporter protein CcmB [Actinomycetota bacterium]
MNYIRQILIIVRKDIAAEIRTKEMLNSMLVFVILTMVIFHFAFGEVFEGVEIAAGILWAAFLFAAVLGLNRIFVHEKDEGCLDGLMLCPTDRAVIYFGKVVSSLIFIFVVQILALPIFFVFFIKMIPLSTLWLLILLIILSNVGITSVGTLLSAISINTKARDLMLPILFFPVIIPILIAAVKSTGLIMTASKFSGDILIWLRMLVIYDIIFLLVGFLTFEYVLEE